MSNTDQGAPAPQGDVIAKGAPLPSAGLVPADRDAVLAQAVALIATVPEAPENDGTGILADLLATETWEDFNVESHLPSGEDVAGKQLKVLSIWRSASDLEGLLPWYLIVDSVATGTGKPVRWQTSSPGLVVPLAKLHAWGNLPAVVVVRQADKVTKRGFRPLNLQVEAVSGGRG